MLTENVVTKIVKELFESKSQPNGLNNYGLDGCYKNRQRTF